MHPERYALPILRTKLHPPLTATDIVPRPHLIDQLNQSRHQPLTLISAPAGYGKSTLISSWLDSLNEPSAWLSLDEHDNNLHQFLSYILAAIQPLFDMSFSQIVIPEPSTAALLMLAGLSTVGRRRK